MMKATDLQNGDHVAAALRPDRARNPGAGRRTLPHTWDLFGLRGADRLQAAACINAVDDPASRIAQLAAGAKIGSRVHPRADKEGQVAHQDDALLNSRFV
jgi:hypothetical protein